MIYLIKNIKWDTDGEEVDLPTEIEVNIPNEDFAKYTQEEIYEYISDKITDVTGFCHKGYSF